MARNPFAKAHRVLGKTDGEWTALKNRVEAFLRANEDKQEIPDADLRALDAALSDPLTWNQVRAELGL